jgi:membrane protease YdiL (CAAX protease family)
MERSHSPWKVLIQASFYEAACLVGAALGSLLAALGLQLGAETMSLDPAILSRFGYLTGVGGILGASSVLFIAARAELPWNRVASESTRSSQGELGTNWMPIFVLALICFYPVLVDWTLGYFNPAARSAIKDSALPTEIDFVVLFVPLFVVVGSIASELFFRGWLWRGLREEWGFRRTILVTSAMFALINVTEGWVTIVLAFPLGLGYGIAREIGGGLRLPIIAHILYSGVFLVAPWLVKIIGAF